MSDAGEHRQLNDTVHPAPSASDRPLVLACGALATELRAVLAASGLLGDGASVGGARAVAEVRYLPANLHNRPEGIVPALTELLADVPPERAVLVAYADCGTGGLLDVLVDGRPNTSRLPGAHCYEVFAGGPLFAALHDAEPGTFYLTDFLAKHFDALVWQGLGLDRHPQLASTYFGNYTRVVLLSQSPDDRVVAAGRQAAAQLGLVFEHRHVGRYHLADAVAVSIGRRTTDATARSADADTYADTDADDADTDADETDENERAA